MMKTFPMTIATTIPAALLALLLTACGHDDHGHEPGDGMTDAHSAQDTDAEGHGHAHDGNADHAHDDDDATETEAWYGDEEGRLMPAQDQGGDHHGDDGHHGEDDHHAMSREGSEHDHDAAHHDDHHDEDGMHGEAEHHGEDADADAVEDESGDPHSHDGEEPHDH